nr:putative ribonuclease H-like domain-containing protein [Tanacetum cinerariifolium]
MRIDELHKFNDGTLNNVCNTLNDRLKGIKMQYLPQTIWRKGDKDRAAAMIQAIDKMLKTKRIMRSLESKGFDSQVLENQVNDKNNTSEGYHAVPPPYTGNFMPPKPNLVFADEHVVSESVTSLPGIAKSEVKTILIGLAVLTDTTALEESLEDEVADDARKKSTEVPRKENDVQDLAKQGREIAQRNEFEIMFRQDKNANDNRMFTPVCAARSTYVYLSGSIPVNATALPNADLPIDHLMPDLEDTIDTRIFSGAYDDELKGVEADFNNLELTIMDVKSVFPYGTKEEEVYVCQPLGFEDPYFPNKVEKALYGLHQAPRAWYETLSTYLLENGFKRGIIDKTLFINKDKDDILINAQEFLDEFYGGAHLLLRVASHAEA